MIVRKDKTQARSMRAFGHAQSACSARSMECIGTLNNTVVLICHSVLAQLAISVTLHLTYKRGDKRAPAGNAFLDYGIYG